MQNLLTLLLRALVLLFILCLGVCLFGQTPTPTPENPFVLGTNSGLVFDWYTVVYGGIITALTYIQSVFFPKAGRIPSVAVRYLLIAVVAAILFISLGFGTGLQVFMGFVGSALFYDKVLSPLGLKTPAPKLE